MRYGCLVYTVLSTRIFFRSCVMKASVENLASRSGSSPAEIETICHIHDVFDRYGDTPIRSVFYYTRRPRRLSAEMSASECKSASHTDYRRRRMNSLKSSIFSAANGSPCNVRNGAGQLVCHLRRRRASPLESAFVRPPRNCESQTNPQSPFLRENAAANFSMKATSLGGLWVPRSSLESLPGS